MTFGSLFAGIGGLDLGLERAGMVCKWQVEIDPYCRAVLEKHWPQVKRFDDVRELTGEELEPVDLICGGFPCQPFSVVGPRRGKTDDRNLWPEMLRVVAAIQPRWVVGENTPGIGDYLDEVCDDLEAYKYEVLPIEIPAAAFEAWHLRYRTFVVAHRPCKSVGIAGQSRLNGRMATFQNSVRQRCDERRSATPTEARQVRPHSTRKGSNLLADGFWDTEPGMGRVVHGVPNRVDRIRALGNAVVPQVAEWIGRRILDAENASG